MLKHYGTGPIISNNNQSTFLVLLSIQKLVALTWCVKNVQTRIQLKSFNEFIDHDVN